MKAGINAIRDEIESNGKTIIELSAYRSYLRECLAETRQNLKEHQKKHRELLASLSVLEVACLEEIT